MISVALLVALAATPVEKQPWTQVSDDDRSELALGMKCVEDQEYGCGVEHLSILVLRPLAKKDLATAYRYLARAFYGLQKKARSDNDAGEERIQRYRVRSCLCRARQAEIDLRPSKKDWPEEMWEAWELTKGECAGPSPYSLRIGVTTGYSSPGDWAAGFHVFYGRKLGPVYVGPILGGGNAKHLTGYGVVLGGGVSFPLAADKKVGVTLTVGHRFRTGRRDSDSTRVGIGIDVHLPSSKEH